jgi:hypothetical protein
MLLDDTFEADTVSQSTFEASISLVETTLTVSKLEQDIVGDVIVDAIMF